MVRFGFGPLMEHPSGLVSAAGLLNCLGENTANTANTANAANTAGGNVAFFCVGRI